MTRLLVVAPSPVTGAVSGTGIRALELARVLAEHVDVHLAAPGATAAAAGGLPLTGYHPQAPRALHAPLAEADVVFAPPAWPLLMQAYRRSGARLLFDLYVPEALETVGGFPGSSRRLHALMTAFATDRLLDALRLGTGFVCASERQRDLLVGTLLAERAITPKLVAADASLRRLVDVVAFGVASGRLDPGPGGPRRVFGHRLGDELVIWNGGLWPWLDYETPIRAVAELHRRRPGVRLLFMGAAPQVPAQRAMADASSLAQRLGVLDSAVLFHREWVPYDQRGEWLAAADVAISAHEDHLETRFAFRTRLLDCFWARLPVVCAAGDELADAIEREQAGRVVVPGDVPGTAAALERILEDGRSAYRPGLDALAERFAWSQVAAPLVDMVQESSAPHGSARPRPGHLLRRYAYLAGRRALNAAGRPDWPAL